MNAEEARQYKEQLDKARLETARQEEAERQRQLTKYREERIPIVRYYFENVFPEHVKEAVENGKTYLYYGSHVFNLDGEKHWLSGDIDCELLEPYVRAAGYNVRWSYGTARYSDDTDEVNVTSFYVEW